MGFRQRRQTAQISNRGQSSGIGLQQRFAPQWPSLGQTLALLATGLWLGYLPLCGGPGWSPGSGPRGGGLGSVAWAEDQAIENLRVRPDPKFLPPKGYVCFRAGGTITVDGKLDETAWQQAAWTDDFVDIEGSAKPAPRFRTRARMLWDDEYFYIAAELEEPHAWGTLIEHDAVTELFNATVEMANKRGLLSGEHFSVDGTLIQAWASHKSMRRKDGSDDGRPPEDWRGEPRSNDTHASTSDPESQLYRKSNAAPALPSYLGHVLTDNRHGLVVNVQASTADGTAERSVAAQMLADVAAPGKRVTVGADEPVRNFVCGA